MPCFLRLLPRLLLLTILCRASCSTVTPALAISSVTSLPSSRFLYPPPSATTVPHLSFAHVCTEDDAQPRNSVSFNVSVSVSLSLSPPPADAAAPVRVSWQFAQQELVSGAPHACGADGEGGCEVARQDVEAAIRAAAAAGQSAAVVQCSFVVEECAAVSVAAWTQLSLCDTQRADVPSWAFSSPFPSDAAQQPQAALTLAIIKPDAAQHTRAIVREVEGEGFHVLQRATLTLPRATAAEFYAEHAARSFFPELLQFMTSGPCTVLLLQRPNAVAAWRALIGPTDSAKARLSAPRSLRAKYGTDGQQNAFHGSDSAASAAREISIFFPSFSYAHAAAAHATRWPEVERASQARAITLTAQAEGAPFAFTVVPSRRTRLVGAEGAVLSAEQGGAVVGDFVLQHGVWAPASTRMFHGLIGSSCQAAAAEGRAPPLVVDVGANVGYFALLSLALGCRVTALEPQQHITPLVKSSLALNHPSFARRLTWLPCAAAGATGQQLAFTRPPPGNGRDVSDWGQVGVEVASGSPSSSAAEPACGPSSEPSAAACAVSPSCALSLDDAVSGSDEVLLLKIDVEGFEADVIGGARRLLQQRQAKNILLEVHEAGHGLQERVLGEVMRHGYDCLQYTEVYWVEAGTPLYSKFDVPDDDASYAAAAAAAAAPSAGTFRSCLPFTNASGDFWLRRAKNN